MNTTNIDETNRDTIHLAHWQRCRVWLIGLSLGVLLALFAWPATRWLVRAQFGQSASLSSANAWTAIVDGYSGSPSPSSEALHRTANRHPDDYLSQLADALMQPSATGLQTPDVRLGRLRKLTARFPNSPSLYATILRYAAQTQCRIYRDEQTLITGEALSYRSPVPPDADMLAQLAAYDRDAAAGERLDPDNAYFPFLRAAGLFAAHRDTEALAAIQRAAQKPTWTEYYDDQLAGEWQLLEETFGPTGALPRTSYAYAILFPHYAQLRAASHVAVAKAMQAEQAGNVAEGLAIRKAVRRCGSLMRVQERSLIGCLVGVAITRISLARPGGAAIIHVSEGREPDSRCVQLLREYDAYFAGAGRASDSVEVHAEIAAGMEARDIIKQGLAREPLFDMALSHLSGWWIVDMLLLANALWMLALGGATGLLARLRRRHSGQELTPYARRGMFFSLITCVTLTPGAIFQSRLPSAGSWLAVLLLFGGLTLLWPGLNRAERGRALGVYALSLVVVTLCCAVLTWQARGAMEPMALVMLDIQGLTGTPLHGFLAQNLTLFVVTGAFTVPLLTLLTLSLLSRVWRVPLTVGLTRGLWGCAVPLACVVLLAYSVCVPFTLRQENAVAESLKRSVQHEGRYLAELIGREWPGESIRH